jgi:hypothetical protein
MKLTNMDQGVRGYIINTAKRNFWRVAEYYEFEDLLQDGAVVWARIVARYPNVTEPKQRMGLFKVAFANHIHDLSKEKSKLEFVREAELPAPLDFLREGEDIDADPDLVFILKELPPAIARVIVKMQDGQTFRRRIEEHGRETSNERACRLAGLDPNKRNIRRAIQAYIAGARLHPQYD